MSLSVALITPSYSGDFESCRLLCETVDAYVSGYETHYVVAPDHELGMFAALAGPRRRIVAESTLLPSPLHRLPPTWKGRQYYWMRGALPVRGWHTQQLRKFGMAVTQPAARVVFLDSDNVFVRPFDVSGYAGGETPPLHCDPAAIRAEDTGHPRWLQSAHRLLGLDAPSFPADDFIGQMIVWDVAVVRQVLARIEQVTGTNWAVAMLRQHAFSEYLIYGAAVTGDPALRARHRITTVSPCLTYWQGPALDAAGLARFVAQLAPEQSAIAVQSFTRTPLRLLRDLAFPPRLAA